MTERFVRDQNISRFEALLEAEADGEKRELLHDILMQEEDRIVSSLERAERLNAFIERLAVLVARQKRVIADLVAVGRDERDARLLLAQLNRTHTLFKHRRQVIGGSMMVSFDPTPHHTNEVAFFPSQTGGDGGVRAVAAKGRRMLGPLRLPGWHRPQGLGLF